MTGPHDCIWRITGTQQTGAKGSLLDQPRTIVALSCEVCHLPITQILSGHWDGQLLRAVL